MTPNPTPAVAAAQPSAEQELRNIVNAQRFNKEHFEYGDESFADWAINRARHTLQKIEAARATPPTEASAEPAATLSALITAMCGKWSGSQKIEAGDAVDFVMRFPFAPPTGAGEPTEPSAADMPAAVRESISEFQIPGERGKSALRLWSYEIARRAAARAAHVAGAPGYLPRTRSAADGFEPHEWVIDALREAVTRTLMAPPGAGPVEHPSEAPK